MKALGNLYLVWRKSANDKIITVGIVKRNASKGTRFMYIPEGVREAKKLGFTHFESFPSTISVYSNNVLGILEKRLKISEENYSDDFLKFFCVDPEYIDDVYYMLAYTHGKLQTDNFEFLADYNPVKGMSFVTELCNVSTSVLSKNPLVAGEKLKYRMKSNVVEIIHNGQSLGFVNDVHAKAFFKRKVLNVTLQAVNSEHLSSKVYVVVSL